MPIEEINNIGESAFYSYSFEKTNIILSELERLNWSNIADKNLEENSGFYTRLLDIVDDRVTNNTFMELSEDSEGKSHLLLRVLRIRTSISQYRLIFLRDDVEKRVLKQVEIANKEFEKTKLQISTTVKNAQDSIKKMSVSTIDDINKHLQDSETAFEDKLSKEIEAVNGKIEPQLITTVLTLMGVFSAVITIIMSVVITSSSWLNNANGSSAIIAFIIPNLVAVFSIAVLLSVIYSRRKSEIIIIPENNWNRDSLTDKALKKVRGVRKQTLVMITLFTTALVVFAMLNLKYHDKPHTRYVLSPEMYQCVEIQDDETEEIVIMIEFQINDMNYVYPYNEEYFHDEDLYFCEEHQELE